MKMCRSNLVISRMVKFGSLDSNCGNQIQITMETFIKNIYIIVSYQLSFLLNNFEGYATHQPVLWYEVLYFSGCSIYQFHGSFAVVGIEEH